MRDLSKTLQRSLRSIGIVILLLLCIDGLFVDAGLAQRRGGRSGGASRSTVQRPSGTRSSSAATSRSGRTTRQGGSIQSADRSANRQSVQSNQSNRQTTRNQYQTDRQTSRDQGQSNRQDQRTDRQSNRQETYGTGQEQRTERQDTRQEGLSERQNTRQEGLSERQDTRQDFWDDNRYYGWNNGWWYDNAYWNRYYPPGFWLATIGTTALLVDATNNIYYDSGVYYEANDGGYTVVAAPAGASVTSLPKGFITTPVDDQIYYYYLGTFYTLDAATNHYIVVNSPEGAIVPYLPQGYTRVQRNGREYYQFAGTYYLPYYQDDQLVFMVTSV